MVLEISHQTQTDGAIAGFRYLWAYYVNGYRADKHCQDCFIGSPVPDFTTETARVGHAVSLARNEYKYVYVCGFAAGPNSERYRRNFHLPLRYEEGKSVSAATYNNYIITAHNAVLLQIPALKPGTIKDSLGVELPEEHIRCKNFQFAVEVFDKERNTVSLG